MTAPNPCRRACAVNRGQRASTAERSVTHGLTAVVAVQARALVVLQLEEFQQLNLFAGRGHHAQVSSGIDEQDSSGAHVQQLGAAGGQEVEKV
jgi:hypothetical protein